MRIFLDTEFVEDGRTIDLISVGMVSETGQSFYRQNANADLRKANSFVRDYVIPKLTPCPGGHPPKSHMSGPCPYSGCDWKPTYHLKREIVEWVKLQCTPGEKPEFWGYYADYDWVVLCQLYGPMIALPTGWPMYCRDLKQLCDDLGNPDLPAEGKSEHNSLADAWWNARAWAFLDNLRFYQAMREVENARKGNQQEVSPRKLDQESGDVRSAEARRGVEIGGGGDQQRGNEKDREARRSPEKEGVSGEEEGQREVPAQLRGDDSASGDSKGSDRCAGLEAQGQSVAAGSATAPGGAGYP